jgi:ketol-acid reductoisomerase
VFDELYERVRNGEECRRVLESTGQPDYKDTLNAELSEIRESEMWSTGAAVRALRPKEEAHEITAQTKGVGGRDITN